MGFSGHVGSASVRYSLIYSKDLRGRFTVSYSIGSISYE